MKITYPACFYPEENGTYSVEIPDLGCATQGRDLTDAIEMAADAAAGWILDALSHGETIPKASKVGDIIPEDDGFVSVVLVDLTKLEKSHSDKPVKKTLTIPSWVNEAGEKHHINFSATLTEAIIQKLQQ